MSSHSSSNGPIAILKLPKTPKALLTFAKAVHSAMAGNPDFPSPTPPLDAFEVHIIALDDAETRAATRANGAAVARDAVKRQVMNDLSHLRDYVQGVAETSPSPSAAAAVITGAFMSVRRVPQRVMPELAAKNTGVSGQIALAAKPVAPVAAYFWEHSPDQVNWTALPQTIKASTTIDGLPWAKVAYFRYRALTRAGNGDYSQVVSLLVQ